MRSFHRGFRSFHRNYTRNLILVVLLFVCLTFSMSMLAVKLAADSQVETIKATVGNYGEIKVSSEYQMEQFEAEREKSQAERQAEARSMTEAQTFVNRVENLVPEELTDEFSQDEYIKTYDKVLESMVTVPGITNTSLQQMFSMRQGDEGPGSGGLGGTSNANMFSFNGNTNGASASDFSTGAKKLVSGAFFTYEDYQEANPVVLIEKNLAAENELKVGDTIEAQISGASGADSTIELKIVGIYETVEAEGQSQEGGTGGQAFNPAGSSFYAPTSVVQKLNATPGYLSLGSYYFDSVDDTAALKATFKAETKGTDGKYTFATDLSDYQSIADPVIKARNTSMIGLAGALGACALIILLAMFIIVGGRTRELGILKAIGSTNRQVIGQFAVEVLCICLVAIILAMGVTALIGQSMGNWLLPDTGASTSQQTQQSGPGGPGVMRAMSGEGLYKQGSRFNFGAQTQQKEAAKLNVVYRGTLFLYGVLILIGISLVGMAIPVLWITRLRPARVLSME
ncbi:MAG: ABC transporter permease [Actinobacteria bacterium]|nr:ABC transporter permease [Actinomycetota bacterium]